MNIEKGLVQCWMIQQHMHSHINDGQMGDNVMSMSTQQQSEQCADTIFQLTTNLIMGDNGKNDPFLDLLLQRVVKTF